MSEQKEQLRERVLAARKAEISKARTLCVTSGKGGVGKTSFSVNFALALAKLGKKTVIIDGDFGFSNVNIMLGKNAKYSMEHVVRGEKELEEVMEESYPGVWYTSGGSGVLELLHMEGTQMERILRQLNALERRMDYIIFDTGAGINSNILRMMEASDQTVLVTTPEPTSILDGYVVIKTASTLPKRPEISVVVNKAVSEKDAATAFRSLKDVAEKQLCYRLSMLGFIFNEKKIPESVSAMVPYMLMYPYGIAAAQYQQAANQMANMQPIEKESAVQGFFMRLLKRRK